MMAKLRCWIFGHQYRVVQRFSGHSRRVVCDDCRADWGMNDHVGSLIPWSDELAEIYRMRGIRILKP